MTFSLKHAARLGAALMVVAVLPMYTAASSGKHAKPRQKKHDDALTKLADRGIDTVPVIITVDPAERNAVKDDSNY